MKVHLCLDLWTPDSGLVTAAFKLKRKPIQVRLCWIVAMRLVVLLLIGWNLAGLLLIGWNLVGLLLIGWHLAGLLLIG